MQKDMDAWSMYKGFWFNIKIDHGMPVYMEVLKLGFVFSFSFVLLTGVSVFDSLI